MIKVKTIRTVGRLGLHEMLLKVQEAVLEGWRLPPMEDIPSHDLSRRRGNYTLEVKLVKEVEHGTFEALPDNIPELKDFSYCDSSSRTSEELLDMAAWVGMTNLPKNAGKGKGGVSRLRSLVRKELGRVYTLSTGLEPPPVEQAGAAVSDVDLEAEDNSQEEG